MAHQQYTAQKFFRSFRLNVNPKDKIGLDIHLIDKQSEDAPKLNAHIDLLNLSLSGLAFVSDFPLELDQEVVCRIKLKKKIFDFKGEIVRVARYPEKSGCLIYGIKFYRVSDENARQFIETLVAYFSVSRLKRELIGLLSNEIQLGSPTLNDFMALMEGLYADLRRFERNEALMEVLLEQFSRYLTCENVNLIVMKKGEQYSIDRILPQDGASSASDLSIRNSIFESSLDRHCTQIQHYSSGKSHDPVLTNFESETRQIHHVMAAPVYGQEGEVIGFLSCIRRSSTSAPFSEREKQLASFFSFTVCNLFLDCLYDTGTDTILFESPTLPRKYAFIGEGLKTKEVRHFIQLTKSEKRPVLISGEEGNGKELLARIIHTEGNDGLMPYGVLDCRDLLNLEDDFEHYLVGSKAAIGKFELYSGGTLIIKRIEFLDLQQLNTLAQLLTHKNDLRIIATTSLVMNEAIEYFPEKLHEYFLSMGGLLSFTLSPLRERLEDIPSLIRFFTRSTCDELGLTHKKIAVDLVDRFMSYRWPKNVRELKLAVERMVLFNKGAGLIKDLPPVVAQVFDPYHRQRKIYEKFLLKIKQNYDQQQWPPAELLEYLDNLKKEESNDGQKKVA